MKQFSQLLFFLFIAVLLSSCGDNKTEKRNKDFLTPLKIEIPIELAKNTETVEFIQSSEGAINEFSDNIEELAIEGKDILSKNTEDLNAMDKIKLGKMAIHFVSNSTQMVSTLQKVQLYAENAESNGLDESQIKALENVEKAMEKRISEINNKYKDYFK